MFMQPNRVMGNNEFHISYNAVDCAIYGSDTTAIVKAPSAHFLVLNGNHFKELCALVPLGYEACVRYFRQHIDQANLKFCDPLEEPDDDREGASPGGEAESEATAGAGGATQAEHQLAAC